MGVSFTIGGLAIALLSGPKPLNNSIFPMDRPGKIAATSRKPSRSSGPRNDHRRELRAPGSVRRQNYQGEWTQRRGGADLVKAAIHVDPFKCRVQGQALPKVAFHQDSLHRPLLSCLRIPKPFGE